MNENSVFFYLEQKISIKTSRTRRLSKFGEKKECNSGRNLHILAMVRKEAVFNFGLENWCGSANDHNIQK